MKCGIPTVNVAVVITVPTIHRMSLVCRFAISVRTPAIRVQSRSSRFAISVLRSATETRRRGDDGETPRRAALVSIGGWDPETERPGKKLCAVDDHPDLPTAGSEAGEPAREEKLPTCVRFPSSRRR